MADKEARLILKIQQVGAEALAGVKDALGGIKVGVAATVAAIVGFGISAIKAFKESEEAANQLDQSLANQGIYTKELSNSYKQLAAELQKVTTYDDDAIIRSQAKLQAYLGEKQITKELQQAVLDFATAQKMDLESAATMVGKSIASNTNLLARQGIEIEKTTDSSRRMVLITEALNAKFGGQSQAVAQGLGSLSLLKNTFSDLMEDIGARIAPMVSLFTAKVIALVSGLRESSYVFSIVDFAVKSVSNSLAIISGLINAVGNAIGAVFGTAFGAIMLAFEGKWKEAWQTVKETPKNTWQSIKTDAEQTYNELIQLNQDHNERLKAQEDAKNAALLEKSLAHKATISEEELLRQEQDLLNKQADLERENAYGEELLRIQMDQLNKKIQNEQNTANRIRLIKDRLLLQDKINEEKRAKESTQFQLQTYQVQANALQAFANLATAISNDQSKLAFVIQKAAALAGAFVAWQMARVQALAMWPPGSGAALIPWIDATGYMSMGAIGATALKGLAEGGIVPATPGGMPFMIGEAGYPEAVIPLKEENSSIGGTTTINITVNGGLLGDASSARELAVAIDSELYKLKRNNESML